MVDEQHAVEMVDLVLQTGRQDAVGLDLLLGSIAVEIAHAASDRPVDLGIVLWNRQATFLIDRGFVGHPKKFGIGQADRVLGVFVLGDIADDDAPRHRDLDRGEPDARRVIHRLQHVIHQRAHRVVDRCDGVADIAQARVWKLYDLANGHGPQIVEHGGAVNRRRADASPRIGRQDGRSVFDLESRKLAAMSLDDPVLIIGATPISLGLALVAGAGLVVLCVAVWLWRRAATGRARAEADAAQLRRDLDQRGAETRRALDEMNGRMQTIAEVFGTRQGELARALTDRLDGFGQRLGENVQTQSRATHDSLSKLHERLAVIDSAQRNITDLSRNVVGLQDILANKQQRGAFGQGRMEAIITDSLPVDAYSFQATLSTGRRPDCLIQLPGAETGLAIDAKFPLESFTRFRDAEDDAARASAAKQLRTDVQKHVTDIHERYLVPGETQDVALMFVPSESIYADLYEHFDDLMQLAYRKRVIVVGPSLLMLAIQVCQSILRDQRMREQAHVIQAEVGRLMADVHRLKDRVENLQKHFSQAQTDITQIVTSADKVTNRGARIEALDVGEPDDKTPLLPFRSQSAAE